MVSIHCHMLQERLKALLKLTVTGRSTSKLAAALAAFCIGGVPGAAVGAPGLDTTEPVTNAVTSKIGVRQDVAAGGAEVAHKRKPAASGAPQRISSQNVKLISSVKPDYPRKSLQNEEQCTVSLKVVIGTDGRVISTRDLHQCQFPALVQATRGAVTLWRYQPTLVNGKPVEVETTVEYTWKLD